MQRACVEAFIELVKQLENRDNLFFITYDYHT